MQLFHSADADTSGNTASPTATAIAQLRSVPPPLLATAWRTVLEAAHTAVGSVLRPDDADLDDVAAVAALRTISRSDIALNQAVVLRGGALERLAWTTAEHLALDLVRTRQGRRQDCVRRVDPLRRGDLRDAADVVDGTSFPATPSPEHALLAEEVERQEQAVWDAADRLPRAQREAVAARRAGRRPLSPAVRQALRAAVATLRGSLTTNEDRPASRSGPLVSHAPRRTGSIYPPHARSPALSKDVL